MKRWIGSNAILCLIAINFLTQPYSCSAKNQRIAKQQPALSDNNKEAATDEQTPKRSPSPWYTSSEWWLVVIAALTGGTIGYQAYEMRRATNSQRNKERARLSVEPVYGDGFIDFDKPAPYDGISTIGITITQHGPTKAFDVQAFCMIRTTDSKVPVKLPKGTSWLRMQMDESKNIIEPTEKNTYAMYGFWNRREGNLLEVASENKFVHFFGFITYKDVFDDRHKTTFRYLWMPRVVLDVPGETGETMVVQEGAWYPNGRKADNREK